MEHAKLRQEFKEALHERATKADVQTQGFSLTEAHRAIAVVQTELTAIREVLHDLKRATADLPAMSVTLNKLIELTERGGRR